MILLLLLLHRPFLSSSSDVHTQPCHVTIISWAPSGRGQRLNLLPSHRIHSHALSLPLHHLLLLHYSLLLVHACSSISQLTCKSNHHYYYYYYLAVISVISAFFGSTIY
jgi:hypothetical protein